MRMLLTLLLSGLMAGAAHAADPCAGKVGAALLSVDRDARQGAGLLLNYCGRPVQAELQVVALHRHGFPISKIRTTVQVADARPMAVIRVELPFVQSVVVPSGYTAEVADTTRRRASRSDRGVARRREAWWPTRSASPSSTRYPTT